MNSVTLKQTVMAALEKNDLDAVRELARENRRVLSTLIRMAYDKTTLTGWRAIKAVGVVSSDYVKTDYGYLRDTIRKLLWSLSDESGGIGWSAPEMLGEIVSADPVKFGDVVPLIAGVFDIEEETFRPGILYALKRIAESRPEAVLGHIDLVERGLREKDPLMKIYALQLAAAMRCISDRYDRNKMNSLIEELGKDKTIAWIYGADNFIEMEVGRLAINTANP